jgi:anti-sigma B factor antagonist
MTVHQGDILQFSDISDLDAESAESLQDEVRSNLTHLKAIEIDLSKTEFLDSSGLGGLVSIQKMASAHNGGVPVRVVNPKPSIQQLLELTRLHRLVEIVKR